MKHQRSNSQIYHKGINNYRVVINGAAIMVGSRSFYLPTAAAMLLIGTLLLKATEEISWMGPFFQSVSARTAGSFPMQGFLRWLC